jgi:hypothetical protein
MSGTHVFYNGVELRDCETETFSQSTVYDETGNRMFSKFRIRVSSTVFGFMSGENPTGYGDLTSHPATVETARAGIHSSDLESSVDRMQTIHRLLSMPRGDFWYALHDTNWQNGGGAGWYQVLLAATGEPVKDGETDLYFTNIFGQDVQIHYNNRDNASLKILRKHCTDANLGPKPIDVQITNIFGGTAFRISFEIEVYRILCYDVLDPNVAPYPWIDPDEEGMAKNKFVLSNTWSSEETRDEQWRITRIVEGTLRVRDGGKWAQAFRSLCMPGLLPGYKRISQRFASDPTNLVLKYRIEDRQAEAAPPVPAIDWKMVHTDSARDEYGQVWRQLTIELIGPPRINRMALLGAALNVLDARFPGASKPANDPVRVKGINPVPFRREALVITQPSDKPSVTIMCNILVTIDTGTGGYGAFATSIVSSAKNIQAVPATPFANYNPDKWPTPRPFDLNRPAGIFATYLQSPCSVWHGIPEVQRINFGTNLEHYDGASNNPPLLPATEPSDAWEYWKETDYMEYANPLPIVDAPDLTVTQHRSYPYTLVDIDTRYEVDSGKMVLPLSGPRGMSAEGGAPFRHSVAYPVHAGLTFRIVTVNATREGRPPELPDPAQYLVDPNGVVEELVDKSELVLDAPRLSEGNSHRIFSAQMRLKYMLARPLASNERFRCANNPALISSPGHNWIPGAAIFGQNRIEYHEGLTRGTGGTWSNANAPATTPDGSVGEVGQGFNESGQSRGTLAFENTLNGYA